MRRMRPTIMQVFNFLIVKNHVSRSLAARYSRLRCAIRRHGVELIDGYHVTIDN